MQQTKVFKHRLKMANLSATRTNSETNAVKSLRMTGTTETED